ncbi:MAG: cytochrome c [Rhodospirillales bacterium]|nr:cytochrome c [Rhodospirillales bacterium]MDE0377825.1 cytochrome c [Rhodospirillales bacterium]
MMKVLKDKLYLVALAAAAIAGVVGWTQWFAGAPAHSDGAAVTITIPALSAEAKAGQALFEENCMTCHGPHATGSDQGPPLVHRIYEPNHHADISFILAVRNGVRAHHWPFGDMAPVDGVSDKDTLRIILYVRELQRANGIE